MLCLKLFPTIGFAALSLFGLSPSGWCSAQLTVTETAKLLPDSPSFLGNSGWSVAACGDLLLVGAPEIDIFFPDDAGRAGIFKRDGSTWDWVVDLQASDAAIGDQFGYSVAFEESQDRLAVGAPNSGVALGAVYIFEQQGGVWAQSEKIVGPNGAFAFGRAVALAPNLTVIGAPFDQSVATAAGAVYLFHPGQTVKLTASDGHAGQMFGWAVVVEDSFPNRIVVGAPANSSVATSAVYVFRQAGAGWVEEARLAPVGLDTSSGFGGSVSIADGRIAVGAANDNAGQGSAFVFEFDGTSWVEQPKLTNPHGVPGDGFGASVELNSHMLAVGAPTNQGRGRVHIYERDSNGWTETMAVLASDSVVGDGFGARVSLGDDWLVAGAWGVDVGAQQKSGAAYAFEFGQTYATPFCFGDGSSTPCPCANESLPGSGEGCRSNGEGSRLRAFGSNVAALDDLRIMGDYGHSTTVLLFSGTSTLGGGAGIQFGDGLLCIAGNTRRLGVRETSACGQAEWGPGLASTYGWNPGQTVHLQSWVRSPIGGCGSSFNFSSALEIVMAP